MYMTRAVELARKGFGKTGLNPVVGCVIVKNGVIVGEGYHMKFGGAHAEVNALKKAGARARGADVYVTLDPCCHTGKTPPCTDALIRAGVARVISATDDPRDTQHIGQKILMRAGVRFQRGLCSHEARENIQFYFKMAKSSLPYVFLKVATTLDGKVATSSGFSRGITSKDALRYVHLLRSRVDALITGGGTIAMDNPHMGVRYGRARGRDPLRVLLDSDLDIPLDGRFFRNSHVLVFTTKKAPACKIDELKKRRIDVCVLPSLSDVSVVLAELAKRGVVTVLVEAGPRIITSFIQSGCVDRYLQIIAPKLLGGVNSPTSYEGLDVVDYHDMKEFLYARVAPLGKDFLFSGYLRWY